jgi:hypothetical protein
MGTILFQCPLTGSAVSTGIETEPISFCRLSQTWLELYCPLCGGFHGAKIWLDQETSASMSFSKSAAIRTNSADKSRAAPKLLTNEGSASYADQPRWNVAGLKIPRHDFNVNSLERNPARN